MVLKEIAVHVLTYNLIRAATFEAAQQHELSPRTLSFKTKTGNGPVLLMPM